MFRDHRLFLREYLRHFHHTGAILPSSRSLAKALARHVAEGNGERRVLEVGPGTGSVTRQIVRRLRPSDRLDLVELNPAFVERLEHRFQAETPFAAVAERVKIMNCPIQELNCQQPYDAIVSGLPLNNFSVSDVGCILDTLMRLLAPGGTLSFFEYIAIRHARAIVSDRSERARLRGVGNALNALLDGREFRRDWVWTNVPPAWVHHVRAE